MRLTTQRQKETGAFYTPKVWADKAIEYISRIVPQLEDYVIYDPCCGEGALLEAIPKGIERYGTTLEEEDVEICRDKGFQVWQLDFLHDEITELLPPSKMNRLIVLTNPPYVKLPSTHNSIAYRRYKTNDATALFYYRILKELKPIMLCGFNKLDLYQASSHEKFRAEFNIYDRTVASFITPSKSWNLSGDFPIQFNIII